MLDLADKRTSAVALIAALEREQGAALLDGKPFDARPLIDAREALAGIDAAEAEVGRRNDAEYAAERATERLAALAGLSEALTAYDTLAANLEASSRTVIGDIGALLDMSATLEVLGRRLGVKIGTLERAEAELRVSRMVGGEFLKAGHRRFGVMHWNSFVKTEWAELASVVAPLQSIKE